MEYFHKLFNGMLQEKYFTGGNYIICKSVETPIDK